MSQPDKPKRKTEDQIVADLRQAAADSKNSSRDNPEERAALIQASAIYEVGAALLEQLVKLTRASRG